MPTTRSPRPFYPASPFALTKSSCAQDEVPCLINVTFTPTTAGYVSSTSAIVFTDTYSGGTASTSLGGTGGVATASVSPTSLTFAQRTAGTTSIAQTVTLSNTGDAALAIGGAALSGTNASEFTLVNQCSTSLAVNANCTLNVSFAPATPGSKSATLTVSGSSGGLPIAVPITGSAQ